MAENKYAINEFNVKSLSPGVENIDLSSAIIGMEYFEDILSPTVTAKVLFSATEIETKDGPQEVELFGGESVSFELEVPDFGSLDLTENGMVIRKISADKTGRQGIYLLELVSKEAISNETVRSVKRYAKPMNTYINPLKHIKTISNI